MDRQRKADMMLVLATGFLGHFQPPRSAICLRDMQPVTLNAFRFLGLRRARRGVSQRVARAAKHGGSSPSSAVARGDLPRRDLRRFSGVSVSNAGFIGAMTVLFYPPFLSSSFTKATYRKLGFAFGGVYGRHGAPDVNEALRPAPAISFACFLVPTFYAADLMVTEKVVAKPEVDLIASACCRRRRGRAMPLGCPPSETPPRPLARVQRRCSFGVPRSGICFRHPERRAVYHHGEPRSPIFTLELRIAYRIGRIS